MARLLVLMRPQERYTVHELGRMRGMLTVAHLAAVLKESPYVIGDQHGRYRRMIGTVDLHDVPGIDKSITPVNRQRKITAPIKRQRLLWAMLPAGSVVVRGVCFEQTFVAHVQDGVARVDADDLFSCVVDGLIQNGYLRVARRDRLAEYITSALIVR